LNRKKKISKVSALVYVLGKITRESTLQNEKVIIIIIIIKP